MDTLKCSVCKCRRDTDEFKNETNRFKSCQRCREITRQWRQNNQERYAEYKLQHKDSIKAYRHSYYIRKKRSDIDLI
jgi:hypothetical protein